MTIRSLLQHRCTLDQLTILMRADAMGLPTGRYFGGSLTNEQVAVLVEGLK